MARVPLPILILLGCLLLAACSDDPPVRHVDLKTREDPGVRNRPREITYAYLPQYSPAVSFRRHHRIVERLSKALGVPVRQLFPASFDDHVTMFSQGRIDISFSNPFVYVRIAGRNGAKAFARIEEHGGLGMRGQIICRADNAAVKTIEDCRGKRWLATDPSSAGGYLYPLGLFDRHGIRKRDFAEVVFAGGNQEKVVFGVYSGEYDIGTIREGTLDVVRDKIPLSDIRVVAETPSYPSWVYAARGGLDPALVEKARAALTALDPADPTDAAVLREAGIERIVDASDQDFDPVRQLFRHIEQAGESGP